MACDQSLIWPLIIYSQTSKYRNQSLDSRIYLASSHMTTSFKSILPGNPKPLWWPMSERILGPVEENSVVESYQGSVRWKLLFPTVHYSTISRSRSSELKQTFTQATLGHDNLLTCQSANTWSMPLWAPPLQKMYDYQHDSMIQIILTAIVFANSKFKSSLSVQNLPRI